MDGMCKHVAHGRIRFATARWGLQQPVAPLTSGLPNLPLERLGLPAIGSKPRLKRSVNRRS
jgi:hypothetical protein